MKLVSTMIAAAVMLLPGIAHADYRYDFTQAVGTQGQTGNFSFTSPDLILNNRQIPTSTFTSCNLYSSSGSTLACGQNIVFYNDTSNLTGSGVDNYDAISFGTGQLGGTLSYFANGSFSQVGTYLSLPIVPSVSTLTISQFSAAVPEPATWAMMILGFGLAGFAMRRRQERATVRFA